MAFAFEKLQVCQKAVAFADTVCALTKGFPRGYFFLADQLNRAALSIAANIAEGKFCSDKQGMSMTSADASGCHDRAVRLLQARPTHVSGVRIPARASRVSVE
jgi:hypothetical protein